FSRQLGSPPDHRAHECDAQLGDGVQTLVPLLQDPHLLRCAEGAETQTPGLDQAKCLPRLYHLVQTGAPGSPSVPPQKLEIHDPGRGPEHQKLQVPTLAVTPEL
ncbi:hypothetical protein chiPu_0026947, partial [Chiloscyllium punctatum]|nr:hypothetical protein [Chiloscyllium punctatum]